MPEPKAIIVEATRFARGFSRFRRAANDVDVIEVTSGGHVVGGYLSAAQLEHFKHLMRREREVFRAGELPDDMVAELAASIGKYGAGPED